jgi:hypothetical protein
MPMTSSKSGPTDTPFRSTVARLVVVGGDKDILRQVLGCETELQNVEMVCVPQGPLFVVVKDSKSC